MRRGFQEARGEIVLVQDADLEYDPQDYFVLIDPIRRGLADVVYGSRFLGGPLGLAFLAFSRELVSHLAFKYDDEFEFDRRLDLLSYKAFKREVIQDIDLKESRFGFEPEVTAKIAYPSGRPI